MAGSHTASPQPQQDPVLLAQLESVRMLADRIQEPVAVIDGQFNLLYANPAASSGIENGTVEAPSKCYEALLRRKEPCPACPTREILDGTPTAQALASALPGVGETCGLIEAFPLMSMTGRPLCVAQVLSPRHEPRVVTSRESDPAGTGVEGLGDLIGVSQVMKDLFDMVRLVATSQATVLLQGESGTGKELAARTIHRLSERRAQPFVVVDCGSLPETLLESELFGHVRGAFTGAHTSKKGLFEAADGGTIVLDEIADTSAHFQSKLLRVLQEGEIRPVGSARTITVDVRIISATNKDLMELVKAGTFRQDLYYRLAVLPLILPPLRERREDIPLLAQYFLNTSCRRHHKPGLEIAPGALQALIEAPWPGNVRELKHTIERTVVTARGHALSLRDFCGMGSSLSGTAPCGSLRSATRQAAQTTERSRIAEALRQTGGNRAGAARALKISRANLYNKLKAYGIK
jgi:two-component system response regulator HydG